MESSVRIIWSSWAFCKRNKNSKQKGMSNMNFYCALFWTSPLASLTLSLVMWGESFKWENISTWKVIVLKRDLFVLLKTLFSVCFSISIVFSARVPVRVSKHKSQQSQCFLLHIQPTHGGSNNCSDQNTVHIMGSHTLVGYSHSVFYHSFGQLHGNNILHITNNMRTHCQLICPRGLVPLSTPFMFVELAQNGAVFQGQ